jgi:hypothetical protein
MRLLSRRDKDVERMIDHNIKAVSPETPVTEVLGDLKGGKKVVRMEDEQPTKLLELFDVTPDDVRNRREVGDLASTDIVIEPSSASTNQVYDSLIKDVAVAISKLETVKTSSGTAKAKESSISGIITMSDYSKVRLGVPFGSPDVDFQMTRRFLCCLYQRSGNNNDINRDGMLPREIYNLLEPPDEGEGLVNQKVRRLVNNCQEKGYIEPGDNDRIKMTALGRRQCESLDEYGHSYCSGLPSYND